MKKPLLIVSLMTLFVLCFATSMKAQEATTDRIVLSDLTWDEDNECYFFTVSLEGSRIYTAYNMDILLPQGINVMYSDEDEERTYWAILSEDDTFYPSKKVGGKKTYKHDVTCSMLSGNQLRVSCISQENAEFKAEEGELFTVFVTIDESFYASSFSPKPIITVSGIALVVKEDSKKYVPAGFSCRPFTTGIPVSRELPINISATNKVGTLILPFAATLPEGVKAYTCDAVDEGEHSLMLTDATSFEACKPYIVYAKNGYSGHISGTVDMSADYPATDVYPEGYLTGVLTTTVVNTGYILQNKGDGPTFYDAEGVNFSLPAGRCYLTPTVVMNARALGLQITETVGVTPLQGVDGSSQDLQYYDLSGRPVAQPTQGLYIQNHRLVYIQ